MKKLTIFFFLFFLITTTAYATSDVLTCDIYKTSFFDTIFNKDTAKSENYNICKEIISTNQTDKEKIRQILDLLDVGDPSSQKIVDDWNKKYIDNETAYETNFGINKTDSVYIKNATFKIIDIQPSVQVEDKTIIPYQVSLKSIYSYNYTQPPDYQASNYPLNLNGFCKVQYFKDSISHTYDLYANHILIATNLSKEQDITFTNQAGSQEINGIFRIDYKGHKDVFSWREVCLEEDEKGICIQLEHLCDIRITQPVTDSIVLTSNYQAVIENLNLQIRDVSYTGENTDVTLNFNVDYKDFKKFEINNFFRYDGYEMFYDVKNENYIYQTAYPIQKVLYQSPRLEINKSLFAFKIHGQNNITIISKGFFYDANSTITFPKKSFTKTDAKFGARFYTIQNKFTIMPLLYLENGTNITGQDIKLKVKYGSKEVNTYSGDIIQLDFTKDTIKNNAPLEIIFEGNNQYWASRKEIPVKRWDVWLDAFWNDKNYWISLAVFLYLVKIIISAAIKYITNKDINVLHPFKIFR